MFQLLDSGSTRLSSRQIFSSLIYHRPAPQIPKREQQDECVDSHKPVSSQSGTKYRSYQCAHHMRHQQQNAASLHLVMLRPSMQPFQDIGHRQVRVQPELPESQQDNYLVPMHLHKKSTT